MLLWSFDALARLARRAVPAALVPPDVWPETGPMAQAWPARAAVVGGVECRLGPAPDAPDLAFCISAASGGREALAESRREDGHGVAGFVARWRTPDSPLHRHVPLIWLEFDREPLAAGRAVPFVTYKIDDGVAHGARELVQALIDEGIEALTGRRGRADARGLARCLDAFPATGRLGHVAAMPHRGTDTLRLVAGMQRSEVRPFLERMAWAGPAGVLGETLAEVWPHDDTIGVNLDVDEGLGPRVGIELYEPTSPHDDPCWRQLLGMLTAAGACTEAQQTALEDWPSRDDAGGVDRPSGLARQMLVKLVFEAREPVRAKAYLAFTPQFRLFGSPGRTPPPIAPAP